MSREKRYTPGPWVGLPNKGVDTVDGKAVFETGCNCCTAPDLSEADAALIAAAPELLEALENILDKQDIALDLERKALKAIAKAYGEGAEND